MTAWNAISEHISAVTHRHFVAQKQLSVGGGCINDAYSLQGADARYFVKLNSANRLDMFEAEMAGLNEIIASQTIKVPSPVCCGKTGSTAYLVLEYLSLGTGNQHSMVQLGRKLADMHRHTNNQFGWHRDNTIGSTPQINTFDSDWPLFWRHYRLAYQLELAAHNGYGGTLQKNGTLLLEQFAQLFSDYQPVPSLLHGDLWSGNYSVTESGEPVLYDPSVYYGDRETDLAMTELFGGFSSSFYDAYEEAFPLDKGYSVRKTLYKLYHILNHLNLFGAGYLSQAQQMIDSLLSELR